MWRNLKRKLIALLHGQYLVSFCKRKEHSVKGQGLYSSVYGHRHRAVNQDCDMDIAVFYVNEGKIVVRLREGSVPEFPWQLTTLGVHQISMAPTVTAHMWRTYIRLGETF